MNRISTACATSASLLLGMTAVSFSQTDEISSVVPPGVIFEALAINHDLPTRATPKYNSPTAMAVSPDKKTLYIAQQTAKRIDIVDLASETVTGYILLPDEGTGITIAPDGTKLYATCSSDAWPAGKVCVVDPAANRVVRMIGAGFGSRSPVVTPDGTKLFVCNRFSNDLSVIDVGSFTEQKRIPMVREPYCAAVTPDGTTLVVGNLLPNDRSTDSTEISVKVTLVNVITTEVEKEIRLPVGSTGLTSIAVSPDGNYAFAAHTINIFGILISTCVAGWSSNNMVSIINLQTREFLNSVSLDRANKGMANPGAVAFSGDGRHLCVTHAGRDELSVINYQPFIDTVETLTQQGYDLLRKLDFQSALGTRVVPTGRCPRSLAIVDSTIYTAGYFDDVDESVYKHVITPDTVLTTHFQAGTSATQTSARKGEALFYDAGICMQGWQSCHSCHVFTRTSGLNRVLNSGSHLTPKNTTSMLYSWWTPPTTWIGRRENTAASVIAGEKLELFQQSQDPVSFPLDTFLMHLRPAASPFREKGILSASASRGKELFNGDKAGCFKCHPAPLFTDNLMHAAFVPDEYDISDMNTPSLAEVWRTAPYDHLGSMKTVKEMILLPGHNGAAALTTDEIDDLTEYVLSL